MTTHRGIQSITSDRAVNWFAPSNLCARDETGLRKDLIPELNALQMTLTKTDHYGVRWYRSSFNGHSVLLILYPQKIFLPEQASLEYLIDNQQDHTWTEFAIED